MTGQELRQKREEWNLTIEQLAARLDVTPDRIKHWEQSEYACHPFMKIFDWAMDAVEYELLTERTVEREPSPRRLLSPETEALLAQANEVIACSDQTRARVKVSNEDSRQQFSEGIVY